MTFTDIAAYLRHWLAQRNISPDSMTFIINIADTNAAAIFDMGLRVDVEPWNIAPTDKPYAPFDLRHGFELHGLKFRLESPIHAEPGGVVLRRFAPPPRPI